MKSEYMTIYGRYRKAAGLTQERAAELLGVTVRSVAAWERGESVPPDIRVLAMADIYNAPTICIEHLRFNVAIARDVLPPVPYVHLPQAVCHLARRCGRWPTGTPRISCSPSPPTGAWTRWRSGSLWS